MSNILIIAEHDGKTLNPSTAKTVACAADISDATIDVAVFAESAADIAAQAKPLTSNGDATAAHCPSESSDPDNARSIGKLNSREKVAGTNATMKINKRYFHEHSHQGSAHH